MARMAALLLGIWLLGAGPLEAKDLFPAVEGWKPGGAVQVFSPQNLYEYINGGADLYLACDFEELQVAEYRKEGKASVTVEVYRHRTPRDAFGIYSQERLADAPLLEVGDQGYAADHLLNFLNGRHYVKISGYETGDQDRDLLAAFARAVAGALGARAGLPALLGAFPAEGKVPRSERYVTRNFLGYPFLNGAFAADYERAGRKFRLFLIEAADAAEVGRILERYRSAARAPLEASGPGRGRIRDPHHGLIALGWQGPYLFGVSDPAGGEQGAPYLDRIEAGLKGGKGR
jgi:hypothetical protein